jgi:hypothetical protein
MTQGQTRLTEVVTIVPNIEFVIIHLTGPPY